MAEINIESTFIERGILLMKTDLVAVVSIFDKEKFIKKGLLGSGSMVSFGKKSILVNLQFLGSKGNIEQYFLPRELMEMCDVFINGSECGCDGEATVISHVSGIMIRPFRIIRSTATAFFAANCFIAVTAVKPYGSQVVEIEIVRHSKNEILNDIIFYKKELLFAGNIDDYEKSGQCLIYNDSVDAAIKRCLMKENPEKPCFAL